MGSHTKDDMAERKMLDDAQAREVEEQLFATQRQQTNRHLPVTLPRQDFWKKVALLLDTVEMQIHEVYRSRGPDLKLQNLTKRQANIRRAASDLARRRLVAVLQYAVSSSLRTEGGVTGPTQEIASLDWSRHDPAEREFHSNVITQIEKFKQTVNWSAMQHGLNSEGMVEAQPMAPGTTQLDTFVEEPGGLTGHGPPAIALEDKPEDIEEEMDEEEVLAQNEAYPELEGLSPAPETKPPPAANTDDVHAAAMELAPSKKKEEADFAAWAEAEAADDSPQPIEEEIDETGTKLRIRVLQTVDEPVITIDGELALEAGDVHFLEENMANYLVDAGVAEIAEL